MLKLFLAAVRKYLSRLNRKCRRQNKIVIVRVSKHGRHLVEGSTGGREDNGGREAGLVIDIDEEK
jgi:hypothetical protein